MLALLLPGQGSQEVGMGLDLFETSEAARAVYAAADEALGFEISRFCFEGPEDELRRTEIQQPAVLTTSIALLRALTERVSVKPAFVAGHSLGEYTALVAANAMSFEDAVRIVNRRGRYMQEAVAEGVGSMAAIIGCTPEQVAQVCQQAAAELGQVVEPANYNSPQQTVIAGHREAVEKAGELSSQQGAKRVVGLDVSAPFHCSLMAPAAQRLGADLAAIEFSSASPAVVTNVEALPNTDSSRVAELLVQQVTSAVRFSEMVKWLVGSGVTHFLEVGAGKVLSGLLARIERRSKRANFSASADFEGVAEFLEAS